MRSKEIGIFPTNINTEYYRKKILKNEKKIINKYSPTGWNKTITDYNTGLGFNSLTSRAYHFNVLNWYGVRSLRKCIKKSFNCYTKENHQSIYVQCWANVLRKGEKILSHNHRDYENLPFPRISGNLVIYSDTLTHTFYDGSPIENEIGRLVLFPSDVYHWTDTYLGNSERITIAFDIKTYSDWKYDVFDDAKSHWVKL